MLGHVLDMEEECSDELQRVQEVNISSWKTLAKEVNKGNTNVPCLWGKEDPAAHLQLSSVQSIHLLRVIFFICDMGIIIFVLLATQDFLKESSEISAVKSPQTVRNMKFNVERRFVYIQGKEILCLNGKCKQTHEMSMNLGKSFLSHIPLTLVCIFSTVTMLKIV